jgi:hypothetical protein
MMYCVRFTANRLHDQSAYGLSSSGIAFSVPALIFVLSFWDKRRIMDTFPAVQVGSALGR